MTEITALVAVILGFLLEVAPLLLLSVAPLASLASTAPVQFGTIPIPQNNLIGFVFLAVGIGLFWSVRKRRGG